MVTKPIAACRAARRENSPRSRSAIVAVSHRRSGFGSEALEAPIESGELAAAVDEPLLAAGPGRVRLRIDIEAQGVAGFAVGRTRLIGGAVGHHDRDLVIVRMNALFHPPPSARAPDIANGRGRGNRTQGKAPLGGRCQSRAAPRAAGFRLIESSAAARIRLCASLVNSP